ncbi:hypothetical protein BpHYR1_014346 [Brachionus plicatilis]|uniref:Uncharacterized protein n=1 Tax=Brachionus plicatilis TaxID=10195 RepID=A0A3M7Q8N5_BRAPC|nr:hypothetical protein BpHYR1_014346 [Brachionus plicatilis]
MSPHTSHYLVVTFLVIFKFNDMSLNGFKILCPPITDIVVMYIPTMSLIADRYIEQIMFNKV